MLIKVALKLNFIFISSIRNGHLKKLSCRHFLIINFEKLQLAYKTQKNIINAQKINPTFSNSIKKKSITYFQWFRSYRFFSEALQPRFFAKKMT
jgi:hypothetical protein